MTAVRRFLVRGRVQGVGFRHFVWRSAAGLGLAGWVRNRSDGSVEVVARGGAERLEQLEAALREGPRLAHVERVDAGSADAGEVQAEGFEVRSTS